MFESGDELGRGGATAADLARFFPTPSLAVIGDEIADGHFDLQPRRRAPARPVRRGARRLFAAPPRPLHRLRLARDAALGAAHQLSPLCRPVRALGPGAVARRRRASTSSCCPAMSRSTPPTRRRRRRRALAGVVWHRFQMPAYHVVRKDGHGVSLVNIGVGPANAKNITDHIAVLRPHCWLMVGHCAGLAAEPDDRRLRARARLSAPGPHSRRGRAARRADPGAGRSAGRAAGGGRAASPATAARR